MSARSLPLVETSFDPRTGISRGVVAHTPPALVETMLRRAVEAAPILASAEPAMRARWLRAVADQLLVHEDELAQIADAETGLGLPRLRGELAGAAKSARFYADVAVEGSYLGASSDRVSETALLVRWNIPLGPIAVFGASNFPFGFGVFGHDVASALAAGCPVIVKAHPAHPRLSVRLAAIAGNALASAGAPEGTYELVVGFDSGLQLVDSPDITAIAFTGSQRGGMALRERAAAHGVPVFAEMGTVNPVFVTTAAAGDAEAVAAIAAGFVASFTLGGGQFCTKPGIMFVPAGCGMFDTVQALVTQLTPVTLLTAGIAANYATGAEELRRAAGGHTPPRPELPGYSVAPTVMRVSPPDLVSGSRLLEECFGPVALICEYGDSATALSALARLQGSLAASIFTSGVADAETSTVLAAILPKVGRVALNAWPTGVANTWSQQHGGPWPAASRSEATSVGAGALNRFVRPVALQNADCQTLPAFFAESNPWHIPRRIDGVITLAVPHTFSEEHS